ncbi:MAG TPA: geranylgeranylglyceryl/heptaprenylglyceryl phosphate synthase [Bacteroidia bacterium]|jgi:putative glycerol-1-phosphate prenyltransferase
MRGGILKYITSSGERKKKLFALLIDPDKFDPSIIRVAEKAGTDIFLVGGSLITNGNFESCIVSLKKKSRIPVLIFPGNSMQVSKHADGILFLSLISGRNPDMLIGNHVLAAPVLKHSDLEIIPAGYMLIDGGTVSSAAYMSHTLPIPSGKSDIALATAMAGEMLGLKLIYLEAGSGAKIPVSSEMIKAVKKNISLPVMVGGGIRSAADARKACAAGADVVVVGNAAEKDPSLISSIAKAIHSAIV